MISAHLQHSDDFEEWRNLARTLIQSGTTPDQIVWSEAESPSADLFGGSPVPDAPSGAAEVRVSRAFVDTAKSVLLHTEPPRLPLLYRTLWRLQTHPRLMDDAADPDVVQLGLLSKQVRRDIHKMRAFVRFRVMQDDDSVDRFVAWFEPDHRIERANAPFFIGRFANQRWSILTPRLSMHWDGATLMQGPPGSRHDAPEEDAAEELWLGYYRSIFNPARLKVNAMLREMPRRYWVNMPETRQISALIAGAQRREANMIKTGESLFNDGLPNSLEDIAREIQACRRCPIACNGTRAVGGQGPSQATLMIVGEQPGDQEEVAGRPFVGPAGQLLDTHLAEAGIDRSRAYVTNAVKHFKFTPSGKRRLHQNPTAGEIDTCRWWLDGERRLVAPDIILTLGASAARAVLGRTPSIGKERGQLLHQPDGTRVFITAHPSYLLRLEADAREREEAKFRDDLTCLAAMLASNVDHDHLAFDDPTSGHAKARPSRAAS